MTSSSSASVPPATAAGVALARGSLVGGLALIASNLRGLFTLLIARLLGGAALGTFGVAWAVADLASKFGTLGLDYRTPALVAACEARGDRAGSREVLRRSLRLAASASLMVAVVGMALVSAASHLTLLPPASVRPGVLIFLAVPGLVLYRVSNGLSRGMKVMHHDIWSRGLAETLGSTVALLALVALGAAGSAPPLAAAIGTLISGIVALRLARSVFQDGPRSTNRPAQPGLLRESLPVAAYDFLNVALMRLDVVMLGLFIGRAPGVTIQTVGVYTAAVEIAGGLRKVSQVFTPIFIPVVAEQLAAGHRRDAERSYAYIARWMLAVLLPAVAVLSFAGAALLRLFGPGFEQGATWVGITAAACALNAFVGLGETILLVTRPRWNVINTTVAAIAAVVLNGWLIPIYGPLGAAFGMLLPYALQGVLRGVEISTLLGWELPWKALARPWMVAAIALGPALLGRVFITGVTGGLVASAVFLVVYVAAWLVLGLEPADRAVLERLRHRGNAQAASGGSDQNKPS